MKLSRSAVVLALVASFGGAGLIVACGDDDDGGTTPANDAGSTAKDTGSSTVADTGTSTPGTSGDAGSDAGDAGLTALGKACETDAGCESKYCFVGGNGGGAGAAGNFCTIACDNNGAADPLCADKPGLTGKCNGKGYCQASVH